MQSTDTEDGSDMSRRQVNVPSHEGIIKVLELWSRIIKVDERERVD